MSIIKGVRPDFIALGLTRDNLHAARPLYVYIFETEGFKPETLAGWQFEAVPLAIAWTNLNSHIILYFGESPTDFAVGAFFSRERMDGFCRACGLRYDGRATFEEGCKVSVSGGGDVEFSIHMHGLRR